MMAPRQCLAAIVASFSLLTVAGIAGAETNLIVRSSGSCPSAQAVSEALWAIRPATEWPALTATIDVDAEGLQIAFGDDPTHRRTIPLPADCGERATRVALVIAVWSAEVSSQTPYAPVLIAPAPGPELALETPGPAPAIRPTMRTEVGVAGFYAAVGGWVPGARIELARLRRTGRWGLRASAAHQSARSLNVDMGISRYARTSLAVALILQWDRARLFLSSDWAVVGAITRAHGDRYSRNESASGGNLGLAVDGRIGLRLGKVRMWAALSVCRWALTETIRVERLAAGASSVPPNTSTLPAWDAHLALGTSLLFD